MILIFAFSIRFLSLSCREGNPDGVMQAQQLSWASRAFEVAEVRLLTWNSGLSFTSSVCRVSSAMSKSSCMCGAISACASN